MAKKYTVIRGYEHILSRGTICPWDKKNRKLRRLSFDESVDKFLSKSRSSYLLEKDVLKGVKNKEVHFAEDGWIYPSDKKIERYRIKRWFYIVDGINRNNKKWFPNMANIKMAEKMMCDISKDRDEIYWPALENAKKRLKKAGGEVASIKIDKKGNRSIRVYELDPYYKSIHDYTFRSIDSENYHGIIDEDIVEEIEWAENVNHLSWLSITCAQENFLESVHYNFLDDIEIKGETIGHVKLRNFHMVCIKINGNEYWFKLESDTRLGQGWTWIPDMSSEQMFSFEVE